MVSFVCGNRAPQARFIQLLATRQVSSGLPLSHVPPLRHCNSLRELQTGRSLQKHLPHLDGITGSPRMVDVSRKQITYRRAQAEAKVYLAGHMVGFLCDRTLSQEARTGNTAESRFLKGEAFCSDLVSPRAASLVTRKGNALVVAEVAGISAAKQTSALIPLCHNLCLTGVAVRCALEVSDETVEAEGVIDSWVPWHDGLHTPKRARVVIKSEVSTNGPTGVEMEALTAVTIAALTVYDMCKARDIGIFVSEVRLTSKEGGTMDFAGIMAESK